MESEKDVRTRENVVQHPESGRDGVCQDTEGEGDLEAGDLFE